MRDREVKRLIKTSSAGRWAIVEGIYVLANSPVLLCSYFLYTPSIPYALIFGLPIAVNIIASLFIGKTIKSAIMNRRISKDLKEKIFRNNMIIKSGDKYEGLIFVKSSDYTPQFSATVREKDNRKNKIVFDVDVHASFKNADQELSPYFA